LISDDDDMLTMYATHGPLLPYLVRLLLSHPVPIDERLLLPLLRAACGRVDAIGMAPGRAAGFGYPEYTTDFGPDRPREPMGHFLTYAESLDKTKLDAALRQAPVWQGARAAVERATVTCLFSDHAGLQPHERLDLFQRALRAIVAHLPVLAIHWIPSDRIVDPAAYVIPDLERPLLQGPVNVRLFRVEGGAPGWVFMDTLGMAPFLLPDLECRFYALDPNEVAQRLWYYASYLFSKGDVIEDGHTVDGVGGAWVCRRGLSSASPPRPVLALIPPPVAPSAAKAEAPHVRCPACGWVPQPLSLWGCDCGFMFNTFEVRGRCPACDKQWEWTACLACSVRSDHAEWYRGLDS
jgi:hypothetical protein